MKVKFIVQPESIMGDYIAVNWLDEKDVEKFGLKPGEIFVREDWWADEVKQLRLKIHELTEIWLVLNWHISYKEAHKLATQTEHVALTEKGIKWKGVNIYE